MKRIIIKIAMIFFSCLILTEINAQSTATDTTSMVGRTIAVANTRYNEGGGFKRMLLGQHYRNEWATPVEVEILNLDSAAGGLTPERLGGGRQTRSLRMRGANGKEYVLRMVNKDPTGAIPPEFVGTFADHIVQDQISSSNPYAPLAVAGLSRAAGIFYVQPKVVWVPASPRLQDFAAEFRNTLCLFELRPADEQENVVEFGNTKKIVNSEKMLARVLGDNDHQVDSKEFLKARLFDMFIGDWDRHEDQWVWATFKNEEQTIYKPIPRDRDQAFSKLDGLIPSIADRKWGVRNIEHFGYTIHDVPGMNGTGIALDRPFISGLSLNDWEQIVASLQQSLTDEKIEAAVKLMPESIYNISGKIITDKLKQRRDDLKTYATRYYHFLSKEAEVIGSDKNEFFEVTRLNDNSTKVTVHKINKSGEKEYVLFDRTFSGSETKEIRLYGLDDKDEFHLTGNADNGILVRIMGGKDNDIYTVADGRKTKTKIYDNAENIFSPGIHARKYISEDTLKNYYHRRSFKHDLLAPKISPGYNPDDGVYIGGGFIFRKQKYGKFPFGFQHSVWGNYAFLSGAYNFWYEGIFKETVGKWDLHLNLDVNAPNYVLYFFGLGNETRLLPFKRNYNRVRSDQVIIYPSLQRRIGTKHLWSLEAKYQTVRVEKTPGRFVDSSLSKLTAGDFGEKNFGGGKLSYHLNSTDNLLYPHRGVKFNSAVEYVQNLKDNNRNFTRLASEFSFFIPLGSLTAAFRVGGAANLSDEFEFYQANTLGTTTNLRGYRRTRFAGKSSVYTNSELRLNISQINAFFLKGFFGLLAFYDNGRVWIRDEDSEKWHAGYGGGIWFIPFNKIAFTATYGASKEDNVIVAKAGFLF